MKKRGTWADTLIGTYKFNNLCLTVVISGSGGRSSHSPLDSMLLSVDSTKQSFSLTLIGTLASTSGCLAVLAWLLELDAPMASCSCAAEQVGVTVLRNGCGIELHNEHAQLV